MRFKLHHRLLFFDFLISIFPFILTSFLVYDLFNTYPFEKGCLIALFIMGISAMVFTVFSVIYKKKVVLKPIYQIIDSLEKYKTRNQYETIKNIEFIEGQILNDSIKELVTTIQEQEKEILRAKKLSTVGEIISKIAHEVKNPISTIRGSIQLLKAKPGDVDLLNKFAPIIISELDRMNRVVDSLLDYSRVPVLNYENVDIRKLIDELLLLKMNSFKLKKLHIENHVENTIISTDKEKLFQVLLNLICNAEEASKESGKIYLHTTLNEGNLRIKIIDEGCGMSEDVLNKIGTLFYTTKEYGNGLGIATSKKIIELLGGLLVYTSVEGQGSEFIVELPLNKEKFGRHNKV
ncbi:MAG: hypothetical protein K0R71_447 [Bacillales bacterium]|jgi:signal transduction histidine kinase|nr:hypothetical protein [Bacillales bacterium]